MYIAVKTTGWRTGPPEVLAALNNSETTGSVDPSTYKFRVFIGMETGDPKYAEKLNYGMWVGSGLSKSDEIIYE